MIRFLSALLLLAFAWMAAAPALAAEPSPDAVILARNATTQLTLADYQTELLKLPAGMRDEFATDPKRVAALLNNLLLMKTLAAQARTAGIDRDAQTQHRIALETDRLLAQLEVQHIEEKAAAEFDAKADQFTARARELYLVDKAKFRTPEEVQVSHILFAKGTRGEAAALAAAQETRAKLLAGADFATLAETLSDDPGSKDKGGKLDWFAEGRMDPAFTKAAFALAKPGDISEPVLSQFGYHLIRLDGKRPAKELSFDEAKPSIMAEMRKKYIDDQRDAKLNAIRNDPAIKPNQPAIDALLKHFDAPPPSSPAVPAPMAPAASAPTAR